MAGPEDVAGYEVALDLKLLVNVHIPQRGYVAVGVTLAEATRFDDAQVLIDGSWTPLAQQQLHASYRHVP